MIKAASLFSQVLSLITRTAFEVLVRKHNAEKGAKGCSSWSHWVALLFAQLAGANSLREIEGGMASCGGKLCHLGGIKKALSRSTLSYASKHRPSELFEDVFYHLLGEARDLAQGKKRKFRFKNPLYSLDSSTIRLCLEMFDWARYKRAKGAVKLHLLLDHQGHLPCWAYISNGKTADITAARLLSLPAGAIVAMDRGYIDYALFASWCERGVFFVTRLKDNAVYEVVESREVPDGGVVLADQTIQLTGPKAQDKCPHRLRRVVVWDEKNQRELELLTNLFKLVPATIGAIYKDRWQIELFFKALKQNLKVKSFLGTSENAVKSQLWSALTAILILKVLQLKSQLGWSLSHLAAMFRMNLMIYEDLWNWIDAPYGCQVAEDPPGAVQRPLFPAASSWTASTAPGGTSTTATTFSIQYRPKSQGIL
jgi:hypothetical protein